MQQEAPNNQEQHSQARRRPPVLLGLVSAILLLTLLAVCGISQLALWLVMPRAISYPRSVLAIGEADYSPWGIGPRLPAYNPEAYAADNSTPTLPIPGVQPRSDTVPVAVIGGFSNPMPTLPPLPPSLPPGRSPTLTSTPVVVAAIPPARATASPTRIVSIPTATTTPIAAEAPPAAPVQRIPSATPTRPPSGNPSPTATRQPTRMPTATATRQPTRMPTATATRQPTRTPTATATHQPTRMPTATATRQPTHTPTATIEPTATPTNVPRIDPTATPTDVPRIDPTATPTDVPRINPTATPTDVPRIDPTATPTDVPRIDPTTTPTNVPRINPTATPTNVPESILARFGVNHFSVDEDVGTVGIPVILSTTSAQTIQVNYSVTGGSATRGADYDLPDGTLTFEPGTTRQTIRLTIIDDTLDEPDETIELTLSSAMNAILSGMNPLIVTIKDNDGPPELSINNVSVIEGNAPDTVNATFTVSLSTASGKPITVDYATQDGTATVADNDYQPRAGTLTFNPGQTTRTIIVPVIGDNRDEDDETFFVNLSNPVNATPGKSVGIGTIVNDDAATIAIDNVTELEGTSGETTPFVFTVSLSNPSAREITVDYATEDGTATVADNDYQPRSGTLTFAPGQTTRTITVPVIADDRDEEDETFFVNLSNPVNATLAVAQGVGTIVDDDNPPTLSINNVTQEEGTGGTTTPFEFTVSLDRASGKPVTVDYATQDGTATVADNDYQPRSGTLTFAPGQTTRTIIVPVIADNRDEDDETFFVHLTSPVNTSIADGKGVGTGTIVNDDAATIAIDNVTELEGTGGETTPFVFTVSLSNPSIREITVDYATEDGTATVADNDYRERSGTLTFAPGQTTRTITVPVIADDHDEEDETFFVNLSNHVNATLAVAQGVGTIVNDDAATMSINNITQKEGTGADPTPFEFTVSLSNPSTHEIRVDYATADGTATLADNDYVSTSGTLTFTPGQTTRTINVPVYHDDVDEDDETFFVNLTNPVNATIAVAQGVGTIVNDDDPPKLAINNVTQEEGTGGTTTPFVFTVSLSAASGKTITVDYATQDGTATVADNDYQERSGTLTFTPGQTTRTITVPVYHDDLDEDDETFFVNLTNPVNADLDVAQGVGTIVNDDAVTISIDNVTQEEGTGGTTTPFVFTVSLSNPSTREITVDYATQDGTATVADNDYVPTSGKLTFTPGQTTRTITVPVNHDDLDEDDETFFVNLTNPVNATLDVAQGVGTIVNDDEAPTLSINNVTRAEGTGGTTTPFVFTVSLSAASGKTVTVDYATQDGTATVADNDYQPRSGTLTFNPGQTTRTITVPVNHDDVDEDDETFFVNLTNPVNAALDVAQGVGTIVNDDEAPTLSINNVTRAEGTGGTTTPFVFTVSLSAASGKTITVDYATQDGTATVADNDYQERSGTLTFTPGQTTRTITVPVYHDDLDEDDETFFVNLTNPVNADLDVAQGVGTIVNDDAVTISIDNVTQEEGTGGTTTPFVFTVSLSNPSTREITVDYATQDGTATVADNDYVPTSGKLTFTPGQTTRTITVPVNHDDVDEDDETFFVNLTNPVNATLDVAQGVSTIVNDDVAPTVFFSHETLTVNEGDGTVFIFARLSTPSGRTVTVDYAVTGGSATPGDDYVLNGTTLTFNPGDLSRAFTIDIIDDTLAEDTETVELALSNPQNATLGTPANFTLSIEDNEPDVQFRHANYRVDEDAGSVEIEVVLSHASSVEITVDYFTEDGPAPSATAGTDYIATSGTLTFAPGQTSRTFSVPILDDDIGEPDERIRLWLHNPNQSVRLGNRDTAILTIMDDEPRVQFSATNYTVEENAGTATIEVVLSKVHNQPVRVEYYTEDGPNPSATAGLDYVATSGTLTFAPGVTSQTFDITILDDDIGEPDERIRLRLRRPTTIPEGTWNAYLGNPNNVLLTILDDEPRASFQFSATYPSNVSEDIGTATVEVVLSKSYHEKVTVEYYTEDGPNPGATAGLDYVATSGTLTFAPGVTSQTFKITILDDDLPEANERIRLHLHNPSPNASVGEPVNLTIIDDEPRLQFSSNSYTVQEDAGTATITVVRTGRTDWPVTVDYATSDDTATAGSDYVATSGTLTFGAGVTSRTFTITIIDDLLNEPDERVRLTLSSPSANARLGWPSQATLTIRDNDPPPTVSFGAASYSVNEGDGQIIIPVTLNTPSGRIVRVQYATRDGTATAGSDYVQNSGTLTFDSGQTTRTITMRIINDTIPEPDETFYIDLMNFNNATPGTIITTQVTIIDND